MAPDLTAPIQFDFSPSIPLVRELMNEYALDIGIDLCFQGFQAELDQLPGKYAEPRGCLAVAFVGSEPAGSAALRPLSQHVCEMKRLYVRSGFRGLGLGRQLTERLISRARESGYLMMRLDTLASMVTAVSLYESLGFRRIPAYNASPLEGCIYFELRLSEDP